MKNGGVNGRNIANWLWLKAGTWHENPPNYRLANFLGAGGLGWREGWKVNRQPGEGAELSPMGGYETMNAKQFRVYRTKLFPRRVDAAQALGVCAGAVEHWEVGRRKVPEYAVLLLRCIEAAREKVLSKDLSAPI